ncbi:TetR/AcrR family transcriptional regulator [Pendulispora albinea]|uniref:TetR family transcriptional regulator n=1 Tax=Pendulispora albinea TaxID=2741071 RepID=A0ABZ2M3C8_9BACT
MPLPKKATIAPRKKPQQARSIQTVAGILEAAVRVLKRDGVDQFTTVRVAEEAGVSVGSLYQYFPNREALLFRLQAAGWRTTVGYVQEILKSPRITPLERVRAAVLTVFRTDEEEGDVRAALGEAGALARDSPQAKAQYDRGQVQAVAFLKEALPDLDGADIAFMADFMSSALAAIAQRATERKLLPEEGERWAKATADMFCLYVEAAASRNKA